MVGFFPSENGMSNSVSPTLRWIVILALAVIVSSQAAAKTYILTDVRIVGKEIHAFTAGGSNVTIVLGGFRLTAGGRVISAQDAVLWISTHEVGSAVRHDITVYIEGNATDVKASGARTTDRTMLVKVHTDGRLSASGILSDRPLEDFPLYKRAVAFRNRPVSPPAAMDISDTRGKKRTKIPVVTPRISQTRPIDLVSLTESPKKTRDSTDTSSGSGPPKTAFPPVDLQHLPIQPVSLNADRLSSNLLDGRRVIVARGNVYLSQGNPDSGMFLELRSQSAVIFMEQEVTDRKDARSPYSPEFGGIRQTGETFTGVYLEGDVVLARGDRYFRGPSAFYDFTTDRAIVIDPVFRTVQKQRNIPIYIRAREARMLSAREMWFADAKVSTSDFYTPSYHIGSKRVYLMDTTPYDEDGRRLGEQAWHAKLRDVTFNIHGVPVLYVPFTQGDLEQGNSALRKAQMGKHGQFGFGLETDWHLFRLLGLNRPEGFKGRFEFDWMERGGIAGIDLSYNRKNFTGYHLFYGVLDEDGEDDFGTERDDLTAPRERGRVLMRHKQFLPKDWQVQFELSYISDRNFLETFFPNEFYAGKEQETLLYIKKQTNNWAFTSLLKTRLNRFAHGEPSRMLGSFRRFPFQDESYPEVGLYLLGEPLLGDKLTFFHESHAGVKQVRFPNAFFGEDGNRVYTNDLDDFKSGHFVRLDTRNEVSFPSHAGPINFAPYAVGRLTYWEQDADKALKKLRFSRWGRNSLGVGDTKFRPYGQIGVRTNTHIWAVYDNAESRLWDIHRLKHIITPEVVTWLASSHGVYPEELFVMDADIEGIERTSGMAFNLNQRLQTKRGPADDRRNVDWMRFNLSLGIYSNDRDNVISNGRFFGYRPENSLDRNHLNTEYSWQISDSTMLLADGYYDIDDKQFGRGNIGLAVQRDPRLRYYAGFRYIDDLDSAVGTFGINYKINRKYSISAFEQYDFAFDNGRNLSTTVTITRKFPRWFAGFTFSYDNSQNELTVLLTFWPEGIPEVRIGGSRLTLLGQSDKN